MSTLRQITLLSPALACRALRRWWLQHKRRACWRHAELERNIAADAIRNASYFERQAISISSELQSLSSAVSNVKGPKL